MSNFFEIIAALGIGGLLSSYLTLLWNRRQEDKRRHQDYKEQRYKCIIMLLHAYLNFDKNVHVLQKYGYEIESVDDLKDLLEAELINSYLFGSEGFILALREFITSPSDERRLTVAKEIRKDLWRLK